MSLTSFVKTPRIREAFDRYGTKERTPSAFKKREMLVPGSGGPEGLAGAAFDYLARIHIARILRNSKITVHQGEWISEIAQAHLDPNIKNGMSYLNGASDEWHKHLNEAHAEAHAYMSGSGSLKWFTVLVQYMARADLFVRTTMGPEWNFDASGGVARELLAMMRFFDPVEIFAPKQSVFLNPTFALGGEVGGADADLIIDDRLIELKTNRTLSLTKTTLLQLAGYSALNEMGGIVLNDGTYKKSFISVGVYYARHNAFIEIPMGELFPNNGFGKFKAVFEDEMNLKEAQRLQRMKAMEERLANKRRSVEAHA
ncbi:MAG: hypothetical protein AAGC77_14055 [Pseudomonadota bacterium]